MTVCPRCGQGRGRDSGYCRQCHAAYMREWRKTHLMSAGQHQRDVSRSAAGVYKKRGILVPQPCAACSTATTEMHHIDHERPLEVTWLCRPCHLAWHAFWRETILEVFGHWLGTAQANVCHETPLAPMYWPQKAGAPA